MAMERIKTSWNEDINRDLGFGSVVASESELRLLNRDGTFNVRRVGIGPITSLGLYHSLLTMTWTRFLGLIIVFFLILNGLFGLAYFECGPQAIAGVGPETTGGSEYLRAFFFSVQTFATIGYGHLTPNGIKANLLVTAESLFGLLGFALATGLLFARFSRPTAKILYSHNAIVAPYRGGIAFEFRIANARSSQLIDVEMKVILSRFRNGDRRQREFTALRLERDRVVFFPLSWTAVHPIDEDSPLHGLTLEDLAHSDAEFLVLVSGNDETFAQLVHSRSSYKSHEIVWGARFRDVYIPADRGMIRMDMARLHHIERVDLPQSIHRAEAVS
jgi:inward rectifier potassium channel